MNLEDKLRFMFLKRVLEDMEEEREEGWHVTELVYDCLRRCYYDRLYKSELEKVTDVDLSGNLDEATILTFWIGKKLHEMPLSNVENEGVVMHEYPVRWNGIVGRIDEVVEVDGVKLVLDKKTVRRLPNQPYEHHIKQIEMYSALLFAQDGIEINKGAVVYIDVNNKKVKAFVFNLNPNKAKILAEMQKKKDVLEMALNAKIPPEPKPTWLCEYCSWFERCIKDGW